MIDILRSRLAALAAAGGLAAAAHAQAPADPLPTAPANPVPADPGQDKPLPPPDGAAACEPKVIRWAGGSVAVNGPEVIVRQHGHRGRSTNVITGSGNGFGNTVVVDGGPGGVTVVKNARSGYGNRLVLDPDDLLVDLDAELAGWLGTVGRCKPAPAELITPPKVAPAEPGPKVYRGKANPFWDRKVWSEVHDCNLYWGPTDRLWFRYCSYDDTYRPVADGPAAPGPLAK